MHEPAGSRYVVNGPRGVFVRHAGVVEFLESACAAPTTAPFVARIALP